MPSPYSASNCCSPGASRRGVKPAACSAGQNRLPGRAKWWPVAAEYRPGLMPQKRTRNGWPGAGSTSGTVRVRAASRSRPRYEVLRTGGTRSRYRRGSFADGTVDALADQVGVPVVAGVLPDHVQVSPAQANIAPPPRLVKRAECADKRRWRSAETKTFQNG